MEDGFPHSIDFFGALVLALAHVDVGDDLLPAGLDVQPPYLLLVDRLFAQVVLRSFCLLLLFIAQELLQNSSPFLALPIFIFPLFFLDKLMVTLLDLRISWMRSSSALIRFVTSSS